LTCRTGGQASSLLAAARVVYGASKGTVRNLVAAGFGLASMTVVLWLR
jgi:hypothetical protein